MAFTQFATDSFNRADSGSLGANWTDQTTGVIGIVSNQANGSGSGVADYMVAYYNAVAPSADMASIATVVVGSATNDRSVGVTVRASGTAGSRNFYWLLCNDSNSFIFKVINGTPTQLQSTGAAFATGDRMRLEIVGSTLRAYRALAASPTSYSQIGSDQASGGELTTGYCGITISQFPCTGNSGILDAWEGEEQSSALLAGDAELTDVDDTTITVEIGSTTGGTAPYTYQWYRDTVANFTPGGGNIRSGATSTTFADNTGLSAFTPYWYKCIVTDDVAATDESNQIAGALKAAPLVIYALGDSITKSTAGPNPPTDTLTELMAIELAKLYRQRDVTIVNGGIDGASAVGYAADVGSILTDAVADAVTAGATHVSIMLGANDAADHETDTDFEAALETIIAAFDAEDIVTILHVPTYFPSSSNVEATEFLQSYLPKIAGLIDGVGVLQGDVLAFQYFVNNWPTEAQSDNTHLLQTGTQSLAVMQARAIDRAILDVASGGGTNRAAMPSGLSALG